MRRHCSLLPSLIALLVLSAVSLRAQPLVEPFDCLLPTYDTTASPWLPTLPVEDVNALGWLHNERGHFAWENGARARFVGVTMAGSACFPDTLDAPVVARRMGKLGVNLVRFQNFDYSNSNGASTLARGDRGDTLSETQMARLDRFLYELGRNGIHAHFVLKSRGGPRRDDGVAYWDSTYNSGNNITYVSPSFQALQRRYLGVLLNHVNPWTGKRYADDPTIALYTLLDQNPMFTGWINNTLNVRNNTMSWHQSRAVDTMFATFLARRYGTTNALRTAWYEGVPTPGPNTVLNPGFEDFTDNWALTVGEGYTGSSVIVQGADVAPGEGSNSMRIVVRRLGPTPTENGIRLDQSGLRIIRDHLYRLRIKAKTDSASGRTIRMQVQYGGQNATRTDTLTTSWQTFELTFRALVTDTLGGNLRIGVGLRMGDVFLDGIQLQETGRDGLNAGEAIENSTVARARYSEISTLALRRYNDLFDFYDSLSRSYDLSMRSHLVSLGVHAPIALTNNTNHILDTRAQAGSDFTSESTQWDFNSNRTGYTYSDSTWSIRNYSILRFRDQKIPELSRNAFTGKPFIVESYGHVAPNAHRAEMMLFLPAYAGLHNWDGITFQYYSDRNSELRDRRRIIKDDFLGMMSDPSLMSLMPQVAAAVRNGWIAPAKRTIGIKLDDADLRLSPLYNRGYYGTDGNINSVVNFVSALRIDSLNARVHYTANDYFLSVPNDDDIRGDNNETWMDITHGVMSTNTPWVQAGSGTIGQVSNIKTDNLTVSWLGGGAHATWYWSSLDGRALDSARRSLLTVSTRALNGGAVWTFGDSSLGKLWGAGPIQMENVRLSFQFATAADSAVILHPLDSLGMPTDTVIRATRGSNGVWRVTLNLADVRTPWFGVEQLFRNDSAATVGVRSLPSLQIGQATPSPALDETIIPLSLPDGGALVSAELTSVDGRTVLRIPKHHAVAGTSALPLDLRSLTPGVYLCRLVIGGDIVVRRVLVGR